MNRTYARIAAWATILGAVIATAGYVAAFAANGNTDARFAGASWVSLYTIALFGNVLVLLGLPTILFAQRGRAPRLTLIGYVGVFVPLAILNIGEGTIEGFVKPYLAHHGGIPTDQPAGLGLFEAPALVLMLVGMICLGIAVFKAHALRKWIGIVFIVVPFLGAGFLSGALSLAPDYLLFVALFAVAVHVLRSADLVGTEAIDSDSESSQLTSSASVRA